MVYFLKYENVGRMTKSATRAMDAIQEFAACGFCGSYKAWKTAGEPAAGQPLKGGERARKAIRQPLLARDAFP